MPVSHAAVTTDSAKKYMIQLCKHWSHKLDVSWDETQGRIAFDQSRSCSLRAEDGLLHMQVETASDEELERTQKTVINHLNRFAFREEFGAVDWRRES